MKPGVERSNSIRRRRIKAEKGREQLRHFIFTTVAFLPEPDPRESLPEKNRCATFTHSCRIICLGRMSLWHNQDMLMLGLMDYYKLRARYHASRDAAPLWGNRSNTPANATEWAEDIIWGLTQNHEVQL